MIKMPLNEVSVVKLIDACPAAYFDEFKREFHFDPDTFTIENTYWENNLAEFIKHEVAEMGYKSDVDCKLNSLVLYKPGARSKMALDKIKGEKNTFGYLFLRLASCQVGGEMIVHKNNDSPICLGAEEEHSSIQSYFFICDKNIQVEKTPITIGYELDLVYSLTSATNEFESYANSVNSMTESLGILSRGKQTGLVLFKDRSLPDDGTNDDDRCYLLQNSNRQLPESDQFEFLTAKVEFHVIVDHQHKSAYQTRLSDEESKPNGSIKGIVYQTEKTITEFSFVNENAMNSEIENDEFYGSFEIELQKLNRFFWPSSISKEFLSFADLADIKYWTKPKKADTDFEYDKSLGKAFKHEKTVIVFWPKRQRFDFILEGGIHHAIDYLDLLCTKQNDSDYQNFNAHLKKMIDKTYQSSNSKKFVVDHLLPSVFRLLRRSKDLTLTVRFIEKVCYQDEARSANVESKVIAKLIDTFGWQDLKPSLVKSRLISNDSDNRFNNNCLVVKVRKSLIHIK